MKKLVILLLFAIVLANGAEVWAQGTRKDDIVINSRGFPQGGANVAICAQPAVTTTTPCSPLANLFSNPALTQALVNPLTTDGLGNYSFYAAPGTYTIQIYGIGVTTKVLPDVLLPNPTGTPAGTLIYASNQSGASADVKIQAAINALPAGGGTVFVDLCGAQTIATDVFTAVTKPVYLIWTCGTYTFSVNTTFPKNITNDFRRGASWTTGAIIFGKGDVLAGNYQVFFTTGVGQIAVSGAQMQNVRWWGAVGDSVADDSAAFLAASKSVASANSYQLGGMVWVPPNPGNCAGIGCTYLLATAIAVPTFSSGENVSWYLGGPLTINATVTGVLGFGVIGAPGASARVSGFNPFQDGPRTQINGTANPLFILGNASYMERLAFSTNSQGQINVRCDNCANVTFRDVDNNTGANNTTGAPYQFQSGFRINFEGGSATTTGQANFTPAISAITRTGGSTVTVTLPAADIARMKAGDFVQVSGVTDSTNFPAANVVILSIPSSTTFTYSQPGSNVSSSGGTVTYRQLAPAILLTVGGGGVNVPGLIEIKNKFFMAAGGIRVDTTGGSSSGGQIKLENVLQDGDGIGTGQCFFTCVGPFCNLVNALIFDQISISDFGNGGLPFLCHAGSGTIKSVNMRSISLDNSNFSALLGGNCTSFQGITIDGVPLPNAAGLCGSTVVDGFIASGTATDNISGTPTTVGTTSVSGHLRVPNTRTIYVEMTPPTGLTATLAAGGSLTAGQPYTYVVTAVDDKGKETGVPLTQSIQGGVLTAGPLGSVTITPSGGNLTVNLSWTASTGAASYNIYRNAGAAPFPLNTNVPKYNTTGTTFSDTGAATGSSFAPTYNSARVTGMDSSGVMGQTLKVGPGGSTINKVLLGSGALTYTAIAAQTCQEQNLTVAGAATTGAASASPQASLGNTNLSWSAWVSASGTVSVRVCNPSAASITPSAVTWTALVVQ